MSFKIKDCKGRVILSVNDKGKIVTSRYIDMSEDLKDFIVEVYKELTSENIEEIRKFLDFNEDKDEFCS